ncbi:MAG: hypothetical protein K6T83_08245 [Alicyclobacillus sp.]|nr:hypothetical protein [Alicyclobacillus sp.]
MTGAEFLANLAEQQAAAKEALHTAETVVSGIQDLHSEIRTLEMAASHYRERASRYAIEATQTIDLAARFRMTGAAVAYQQTAIDLERIIGRQKEAINKIATVLAD